MTVYVRIMCVDGSNQGPSSAACNTVATLTPSICTILDQEMVAVLERLLNERENFDLYRLEMDQRVKRITEELVRKDEVVLALGGGSSGRSNCTGRQSRSSSKTKHPSPSSQLACSFDPPLFASLFLFRRSLTRQQELASGLANLRDELGKLKLAHQSKCTNYEVQAKKREKEMSVMRDKLEKVVRGKVSSAGRCEILELVPVEGDGSPANSATLDASLWQENQQMRHMLTGIIADMLGAVKDAGIPTSASGGLSDAPDDTTAQTYAILELFEGRSQSAAFSGETLVGTDPIPWLAPNIELAMHWLLAQLTEMARFFGQTAQVAQALRVQSTPGRHSIGGQGHHAQAPPSSTAALQQTLNGKAQLRASPMETTTPQPRQETPPRKKKGTTPKTATREAKTFVMVDMTPTFHHQVRGAGPEAPAAVTNERRSISVEEKENQGQVLQQAQVPGEAQALLPVEKKSPSKQPAQEEQFMGPPLDNSQKVQQGGAPGSPVVKAPVNGDPARRPSIEGTRKSPRLLQPANPSPTPANKTPSTQKQSARRASRDSLATSLANSSGGKRARSAFDSEIF